ncbi:MFS transporter [Microbacterium sp. C7(2022)]|uniref:MFS transporter n=1 Tax=Microbacterium sp. C7(2022) TaxID=2992759 RepID=UPI00237B2E59|nr:MFS transporter [Microbacterium sp. C7(2022)]MDE0546698.1 MFS transporter [Microbacterium sp. C7(2022)]
MARNPKLTASEVDGVAYRRARTWEIAFSQLNNGSAMIFYVLVGLMSYLQNAGYGIAVAVAGIILTVTRVFDGVIDPLLALVIEKVRFGFGKLRFFMLTGWVIRSLAILMLFVWGSDAGLGAVFFIAVYLVYIVGSSMNDIAGQMSGPVLTNDPRQRPTVQVWATVYSYLIPSIFTIISTVVFLPRHGNEFTVAMLSETAMTYVACSLVFQILACIGVARVDKPESFAHTSVTREKAAVTVRDMWNVLAHNGSFQRYLISGASDKLAQSVRSQAVIGTLMWGILLGNMQLGTVLSLIAILPGIVFAIFGARFTGKRGSKAATVTWTWICLILAAVLAVFCLVVDMRSVLGSLPLAIGFFLVYLLLNGASMVVTVASGAMRADIIDYELDRSGKFLPATVTATYNIVDQIISSLGSTLALGAVALIGFSVVMPQPTDSPTPEILFMTMLLFFGLPILGWICTLIAMRGYKLDRLEMVEVQKRVAGRKAELQAETPAEATV